MLRYMYESARYLICGAVLRCVMLKLKKFLNIVSYSWLFTKWLQNLYEKCKDFFYKIDSVHDSGLRNSKNSLFSYKNINN